MSETVKTAEPKKDATLAEQVTSAKPVVEKPKAKETKPVAKTKAAPAAVTKPKSDDIEFGDGEGVELSENERHAFMRDPAREYPLKDLEMSMLRPKLSSLPMYYARKNRETDITYFQTFKHVIVRNVLYVIDNRSGITLSEQMWVDGQNPFSYLNDDMSNVPSDIIVLENSTIQVSYMNVSDENTLRNVGLKSGYNLTLSKSTIMNGSLRAISSMAINNCVIHSSHFSGDSLRLNDLNVSDYYITVSGTIVLSEIRFGNASNELRIMGENIKDVNITRGGRVHTTGGRCRFDYYGDKTISISSERRVDNGFFMGAVPIPFIKTDEGVLVSGKVFKYSDFKQFIETTLDKLSPVKQTEGGCLPYRPCPPLAFGYSTSMVSSVQESLPGEILNSLYQLVQGKNDMIAYRGCHTTAEKYTEVDSLLTLTNEQIAVLAGQISSRLRLFKELDALI